MPMTPAERRQKVRQLERARDKAATALESYRLAVDRRDELVADLLEDGMTGPEVAPHAGLSHQAAYKARGRVQRAVQEATP